MTVTCDTCGEKMPDPLDGGWLFFTPNVPAMTMEDPRWAICAGCAPLVAASDLAGLLERWDAHEGRKSALTIDANMQLAVDPSWDPAAMREHARSLLAVLVAGQDGHQRRITPEDLGD